MNAAIILLCCRVKHKAPLDKSASSDAERRRHGVSSVTGWVLRAHGDIFLLTPVVAPAGVGAASATVFHCQQSPIDAEQRRQALGERVREVVGLERRNLLFFTIVWKLLGAQSRRNSERRHVTIDIYTQRWYICVADCQQSMGSNPTGLYCGCAWEDSGALSRTIARGRSWRSANRDRC